MAGAVHAEHLRTRVVTLATVGRLVALTSSPRSLSTVLDEVLRFAEQQHPVMRCSVLLADDVLGELDPARRRQFWAAIDPESQVIATGTGLPDAALGEWQVFVVADGTFTGNPAAA